ncbi:MAG: GNAT family N-acetyltransferase [Asgard group archaeon]|nr:GNAT family N-acetyltransferase [Asgard group archaeon]
MIELQLEEFEKVRELFTEVEYNLNCMVVIAGINPGRIWVDSKEKPTSGFLIDNSWTYFLAGNPNNYEFNTSIGKLLKDEIFPKVENLEKMNFGEWLINFENKDWFDKIENEFAIKDPIALERCYYVFDKLLIPDWRTQIPKGFAMRRIDTSLLKDEKLENIEEIKGWIKSQYGSEEKFLEEGLGFCLIEGKKTIASWCLSEWAMESKIEIGIITAQNYRRKGLATLCTAATVELCQEKGYEIGWHTNQENVASCRLAEKVGFVRKKNYISAYGAYKEKDNLLNNAWHKGIVLDKPEVGISYIKKAMEFGVEVRHCFVYARLLVKLKRFNEAIEALMKIVELGPANPVNYKYNLETRDCFQELRKMKEWKELMKSVEALIKD